MRQLLILFFFSLISFYSFSQQGEMSIDGVISLGMSTDQSSIIIGIEAGDSLISQSTPFLSYNTILGYRAGQVLESELSGFLNGKFNVMMGWQAGQKSLRGHDNVYIGARAAENRATGDHNVILGNSAGEVYTGSNNVFVGNRAGRRVSGNGNVIIGHRAGDWNLADPIIWNNRLVIDNDLLNDTNLPLIAGEFDNEILQVNGIHRVNKENKQQIEIINNGSGGKTWRVASSNNTWNAGGGRFLINNTDNSSLAAVTIDSSGNVGIGTVNPHATLHINDVLKIEPISSSPSCSVNEDRGKIFYDSNRNRLRICTMLNGPSSTFMGWKDLHDNTPD